MTATHATTRPSSTGIAICRHSTRNLSAQHTIEASGGRDLGTLANRDELWDQCYQELMTNTTNRLVEEVARLGGHYAHVHDEAISPKHDDAAGEAWMHGRFTYMLYRRPAGTP